MNEGLMYLLEKYYKLNLMPECNAQSIPEYRALEKAKWIKELDITTAKKILEEEYFYQKPENKDKYPGFKWF